MIEISICYFTTRGERRATKGDNYREEDRVQRWEGNERRELAEVRTRLTSFERFICERQNFVFDSLIYLEPYAVERFKNNSNVMKFRSFGDSTSSRVRTS